MALLEDVAGGPEVDREFVDFAGSDQRRMLLRFAMAGTNDAFGEILREAVGPDIDEFGGEIGVGRGRFGEEFDANGAGDFCVLRKGLRRIDENVVAGFGGTLVARTCGPVIGVATEWAADRRDWFRWIVG